MRTHRSLVLTVLSIACVASGCATMTVTPQELAHETERCRVLVPSNPFVPTVVVEGERALAGYRPVAEIRGDSIVERTLFGDRVIAELLDDRFVYVRGLFMQQHSDPIDEPMEGDVGVVSIQRGLFKQKYTGSAGCSREQLALGAVAQLALADDFAAQQAAANAAQAQRNATQFRPAPVMIR